MIILGIDPGLAATGYGVIEIKKQFKCRDYGVISTSSSKKIGERLEKINQGVRTLIRKYRPDILAIENIYFFKNLKTAIAVSEAKGVVLLTAAREKVPVIEFSPLQIKMAMAGYGRAKKEQVQRMVKKLLNLKELPKPDDAADGLAIAICCERLLKQGRHCKKD